jgi:nucleoside-diphosphate-sugar epimerase
MPVMVIGADTPLGEEVVSSLVAPGREVRAFVSDTASAERLKGTGIKVAVGDVSDDGHVGGACTNCFTAVLLMAAATDQRDRAFARTTEDVLAGWARAVSDARVHRVLWVGDGSHPTSGAAEERRVPTGGRDPADIAAEIAALDESSSLA